VVIVYIYLYIFIKRVRSTFVLFINMPLLGWYYNVRSQDSLYGLVWAAVL